MNSMQVWTLLIALVVVIVAFNAMVLYVLRLSLRNNAAAARKRWQEWQSEERHRSATLELQRAAIETRLAAIEARMPVTVIPLDVPLVDSAPSDEVGEG